MPIDGGRERVYVLGRECKLTIEGTEVAGASDVMVRETVTEVDATAANAPVTATVVVMRTYDLTFSCPDMAQARKLYSLREKKVGKYWVPQRLEVSLEGGLFDFDYPFTIHDVEADEPLDGVVIPRFTLKQWWQPPVDGMVSTGSGAVGSA